MSAPFKPRCGSNSMPCFARALACSPTVCCPAGPRCCHPRAALAAAWAGSPPARRAPPPTAAAPHPRPGCTAAGASPAGRDLNIGSIILAAKHCTLLRRGQGGKYGPRTLACPALCMGPAKPATLLQCEGGCANSSHACLCVAQQPRRMQAVCFRIGARPFLLIQPVVQQEHLQGVCAPSRD